MAAVPGLIEQACQRWGLQLDKADPLCGDNGMVVLGHRGRTLCALKVAWQQDNSRDEARALTAWSGQAMVRLLEADPELGVLLLERLDPTRSLHTLPLLTAARIAGGLIKTLTIPAPPGFRQLSQITGEILTQITQRQQLLGEPVPAHILTRTLDLVQHLAETEDHWLIHADLHYGNILASDPGSGKEPWLAVDPKPVAGIPEHSVTELLWTRADEVATAREMRTLLETIVTTADCDLETAAAWAVVRSLDYWLWGLDHGLTEDPPRCQRVVEALLPVSAARFGTSPPATTSSTKPVAAVVLPLTERKGNGLNP